MRFVALCTLLLALPLLGGCGSSTKKSAVGASCVPQTDGTSTECANGLCIALDSATGVCSKDCTKLGNADCPTGFTCQTSGRFGQVCLKTAGCKTDPDCPAGHRCDTATNTCFIKVSRQLCDPCQASEQCPQGGECFTSKGSGEQFCTAPCDSSGNCPTGFKCQSLPDNGLTNQCVPVSESCNFGKALCQPCKGDNECGTALDLCVRNVVSNEQFCGKSCTPSRPSDCPASFSCVDLAGGVGKPRYQCVPNSNTCKGFCDGTDEHTQTIECGVGRTCALTTHQCEPATDGRQCSPCQVNDDCAKPGKPFNQCILNDSPNSSFRGETFCAEPCVATDPNACTQLGAGFSCSAVGGQHFCTPNRGTCQSGLGTLGDNCSANGSNDCLAGVCLVAGEGSVCSAECTTDSQCTSVNANFRCCTLVPGSPATYDCARTDTQTGPNPGASGVCAPLGGAFGDDCSPGHPPCSTGACLDLGTAELCTVAGCDPVGQTGCPADFSCQSAVDSSDPTGATSKNVCFPTGGGGQGSSCAFGPAACEDRLCIKKDSGNVCTRQCTSPADCATNGVTGWGCELKNLVGDTDPTKKIKICTPPGVN